MQANSVPFYTRSSPGWGQKVKTFFFLNIIMLHFNKKERSVEHYAFEMFDLMHTPDLLVWVKRLDIEIVQGKYMLNELNDLIGFGYDLSDTQDGLKAA